MENISIADELQNFYLTNGVLPIGGGEEDGGDKDKGKEKGDDSVTMSKADFDAVTAEKADLESKLEDMKLEVMSPEYLDFLNAKDDTSKAKEDEGKKKDDGENLENLSKKELLALATKTAKEDFRKELDDMKASNKKNEDTKTQNEVSSFSRSHDDFETFRPIMYGLSLDPKNKNMTLQELYNASKEHVKGIHTGASEEEKSKSQKAGGQKPGGDSGSFERLKKLSPDEAANEAWDETEEKLGKIEG